LIADNVFHHNHWLSTHSFKYSLKNSLAKFIFSLHFGTTKTRPLTGYDRFVLLKTAISSMVLLPVKYFSKISKSDKNQNFKSQKL